MPDTKMYAAETKLDFWLTESVKHESFEDNFVLESHISNGPFGSVHICKPRGQKQMCAVKIVPKNREKRLHTRETEHLLSLNNTNVARIFDIYETAERIYIISEMLHGTDVLERASKKHPFTEREAAKMLKQILDGLRYIHEEGLVHGNIKPENFIYQDENDESRLVITDIALNTLLEKDLTKYAIIESTQFCAPEVLRNQTGHSSSDMWSFGAFAYLLLCGEEPFKVDNADELYRAVLKGNYNTQSESYQKLSVNAKDFISKLLVIDPKKRLTAQEALRNQWLLGKATQFNHLTNSIDSMRTIVNKKKTQSFLNKRVARTSFGKKSLVEKYLPKDCWLWLQKSTKYGTSLVDCVASAVENADSSVGLYAPDPECYDTFPEIFWPVISDYHKTDAYLLKAVHDFGDTSKLPEFEPKYAGAILHVRMQVARTVDGYPMAPKLNSEARERIKNDLLDAFRSFQGDLFGDYKDLCEYSYDERNYLIKSNYLFNDGDNRFLKSAGAYVDWPIHRGIFMNRNKTLVVWVNEEDHIRVISTQKGANLKQTYTRLVRAITIINKTISFVQHEKFGFLTFSPTNIGTSLKIAVQVNLPNLAKTPEKLNSLCESLGMEATKLAADSLDSTDTFEISNSVTVGKTEFDLTNGIFTGIKLLLDEEFLQ